MWVAIQLCFRLEGKSTHTRLIKNKVFWLLNKLTFFS